MNRPDAIRRQFVLWGLCLGLWWLVVLAFAGQLVAIGPLDWTEALERSLRDWLPWVILAPAVAWLALRFPLERQKLSLSIPVHLAGCVLAVLLCELAPRPAASPS